MKTGTSRFTHNTYFSESCVLNAKERDGTFFLDIKPTQLVSMFTFEVVGIGLQATEFDYSLLCHFDI